MAASGVRLYVHAPANTVFNLGMQLLSAYQLYFGTLVLVLWGYCESNTKSTDFLQNSGFKENSSMAVKRISE